MIGTGKDKDKDKQDGGSFLPQDSSERYDEFEHNDAKIDTEALKKQVESFRKEIDKKKDIISSLNQDTADLMKKEEMAASGGKSEKDVAMTLGDRLVAKGIISRDQLEIALKEQRELQVKKELGTILVELNFITDTILSEMLSEASGVKSVDLRSMTLDTELIRRIPKNIAAQYKIIALALQGDELMVATSDVYNVLAIDQVKRYFHKSIKITTFFANDFQITEVIDQYYDYEMNMFAIIKEIETGDVKYTGQEEGYVNPTVRLVDSIFTDAVKQGASDIHFEPESEFVRLRYRIDGRLIQIISFHKDYWSAIVVRIKILSGMNIAESRNPQDGRISYTIMGRKVDFRISTLPTVYGENVVARILDKSRSLVELSELGLNEKNLKTLKRLLKRPEGVIIVTGPTGSGKTTTLYSVLSYINSLETNIMTLEDPVEYQLPVIRQSAVREGTEMTFDRGIRTLMRQDPDIIFVGEVRDEDTAGMTIRAAMTGHQVFTTLHTNDALGAIPRLMDIGIKGPLLSGSIICCIAQRLARKLCNFCKEKYVPTEDECKVLGVDPKNPPKIYKHRGCKKCYNTGYKGRVAIYEILTIDKELDDMIYREASRKEMLNYALEQGYAPMANDGIEKILLGVTDLEEIVDTVDLTERLKDVSLFL
jgi:general secretion pathway protein E/type IV pilus assembly protein PilB